jgi:hypothetical protein
MSELSSGIVEFSSLPLMSSSPEPEREESTELDLELLVLLKVRSYRPSRRCVYPGGAAPPSFFSVRRVKTNYVVREYNKQC